jgi:hypothetical protein
MSFFSFLPRVMVRAYNSKGWRLDVDFREAARTSKSSILKSLDLTCSYLGLIFLCLFSAVSHLSIFLKSSSLIMQSVLCVTFSTLCGFFSWLNVYLSKRSAISFSTFDCHYWADMKAPILQALTKTRSRFTVMVGALVDV